MLPDVRQAAEARAFECYSLGLYETALSLMEATQDEHAGRITELSARADSYVQRIRGNRYTSLGAGEAPAFRSIGESGASRLDYYGRRGRSRAQYSALRGCWCCWAAQGYLVGRAARVQAVEDGADTRERRCMAKGLVRTCFRVCVGKRARKSAWNHGGRWVLAWTIHRPLYHARLGGF